MRDDKGGLSKILLGFLPWIAIGGGIALIVVFYEIIGDILGFVWGIIAFVFMLSIAVITSLAPFLWVHKRLDSYNLNPQAVIGLGIPALVIGGLLFTLGASYTFPQIGNVAAPFICPEGYVVHDVGRFYNTGRVTSDGSTVSDYSGARCSLGKKRFRPGRYTYPLVMIAGYLIFGLMLLVAAEVDDVLLRERIPSFWRRQMLFIFGVIVIAILVFQPPPVSTLARIIQPLIN